MYGYGETLAIYPEETTGFLERGGIIAWGIVPTLGEEIEHEDETSLLRLFDERRQHLGRVIPEELLMSNIMLTPSCGTGSRCIEETMKIFQLLMRLKEELA